MRDPGWESQGLLGEGFLDDHVISTRDATWHDSDRMRSILLRVLMDYPSGERLSSPTRPIDIPSLASCFGLPIWTVSRI